MATHMLGGCPLAAANHSALVQRDSGSIDATPADAFGQGGVLGDNSAVPLHALPLKARSGAEATTPARWDSRRRH